MASIVSTYIESIVSTYIENLSLRALFIIKKVDI